MPKEQQENINNEVDYKLISEQLAGKLIEMQNAKTFKDNEYTVQVGMDNYYKIMFVKSNDVLLHSNLSVTDVNNKIIAVSNELDSLKTSQVLAGELARALIYETLITSDTYTVDQVCKMFQMWNNFISNTIRKVVE